MIHEQNKRKLENQKRTLRARGQKTKNAKSQIRKNVVYRQSKFHRNQFYEFFLVSFEKNPKFRLDKEQRIREERLERKRNKRENEKKQVTTETNDKEETYCFCKQVVSFNFLFSDNIPRFRMVKWYAVIMQSVILLGFTSGNSDYR